MDASRSIAGSSGQHDVDAVCRAMMAGVHDQTHRLDAMYDRLRLTGIEGDTEAVVGEIGAARGETEAARVGACVGDSTFGTSAASVALPSSCDRIMLESRKNDLVLIIQRATAELSQVKEQLR